MQEFKESLITHIPGLMRYALALLGSYSAAEDLVQDCMERALKKADQWDSARPIKPWLFSIMHNAFIDNQRRNSKSPMVDINLEELPSAIAPSQPDLLEIRDLIRQLSSLPVEQREILLMVALEGLDYKEISTITGVPIGTVMSRLHRARKKLSTNIQVSIDNSKTERAIL